MIIGFEGGRTPRPPAAERRSRSCTTPASSPEKSPKFRCSISPLASKPSAWCWPAPGKRRSFDASELRKLSGRVLRSLKAKRHPQHHARAGQFIAPTTSPLPPWKAPSSAISNPTAIRPIRRKTKSRWTPSRFSAAREAAVDRGRIIAEAQNFTRDIWPTSRPTSSLL